MKFSIKDFFSKLEKTEEILNGKLNFLCSAKLALIKGSYLYWLSNLSLCDIIINEERHITAFTKAFRHQL